MVKVDIFVPASWQDLSQKQTMRLFRVMAAAPDRDAAKLLFIFRINRLRVIGRQPDGAWLLAKRSRGAGFRSVFFELSVGEIADICSVMEWMDRFADFPVRPERINLRRAKAPDLEDISFEDWLILDNLYQGYLVTHDPELIDDMSEALYGARMRLMEHQRLALFFWMGAVKGLFARRFPNFLKPAPEPAAAGGPEPLARHIPSADESTLTQIRALTKGDITKRKEILAMPCHVALAELDALAKEYEEFKRKSNS